MSLNDAVWADTFTVSLCFNSQMPAVKHIALSTTDAIIKVL